MHWVEKQECTKMNTKNSIGKQAIYLWIYLVLFAPAAFAEITFLSEYKVSDIGLFFDGSQVGVSAPNNNTSVYDFRFGSRISPHGDCIAKVGDFIFTTWYKGGKLERNVMLSRYNMQTKVLKTIEFPHRHTGFRNQWWIGESHNTIAVGISPKDGVIHLLYDMHSYDNSMENGAFKNDYFRYSYSQKNAATVPDADFTLALFVKDNQGDYTHVSFNGTADPAQFQDLTYPYFFLNDENDLLMHMRVGGNDNGGYVFSKYNATTGKWDRMTQFNPLNATSHGESYNWGLYGRMKYLNGKLRVGFQRRSSNKNDKYLYQNGIYYAYSDDQSGKSQWKDHEGNGFAIPLANADRIKIFEPGNLVTATGKDEVRIVDGFDYTVTVRGDVHFISKVKDSKNNVTKYAHTYKPADSFRFINTTNFAGGTQIYTAGNNIYLIDIKNGRPFIQKADGGKNNFTTIYEPDSGKVFRHGVPYIQDGILYYYMMENKTGAAQPMYVHIIDLGVGGLNTENKPPVVALTSPANNATFTLGDTITISANASDEDGTIEKVNFRVNSSFYSQAKNAPHTATFTPEESGTYVLDANAYDEKGLSTLSQSITVTVLPKEESPVGISINDKLNKPVVVRLHNGYVLQWGAGDFYVEVLTLAGKVIQEYSGIGGRLFISSNELENGVYLLRINGMQTITIVKSLKK
jgi:hypothetical protein